MTLSKLYYSPALFDPSRRATRPLTSVVGMTADDWHRVYLAHQAFTYQVRLIVAEVEDRQAYKRDEEVDSLV